MPDSFNLIFDVLSERCVPAITIERVGVRPDAPRIIVLHGLYGRKEEYLEELYLLAARGFRATAIDLALHGDRVDSGAVREKFEADYVGALKEVIYETAADVTALTDYWEISDNSVGLLAVSAGGLVAHAVAVTENRIGAIAAIVSSPDWLTADPRLRPLPGSALETLLTGLSPVNRPESYVPKALLMLVGELDDIVTPDGSILLFKRLLPLYTKRGIDERLQLKVFPGLGHVYTPEMRMLSLNWLSKNLIRDGP
jgi:alpha-beta hydrolase superfamily lysophospholipase